MSEEEKEVLKTFKSGLGLTGVEHKILVNYIDKQQKVIDLMANDLSTDYHSKEWVIKHYTERINDGRNQDKI